MNNNRQILICNPKANDTQTCLTWNSYPYVANNSTWHTSIFDMKQLSMCGKQQEMTYNHVWHETVIHMWQTTANDTQTFLSWSSCPYVANNSKWHTIIFGMKHLSICDKQQQMTYNHFRHETVTIGGKQQQMKHKHLWHETVVHMWQTTANDTQTCLPWNSYPSVANNSKWHRSIFDMKQLSICSKQQQMTHKHVWHETAIHMWQTTANDTRAILTWMRYPYVATTAKDIQSCLTWNSYPHVANNSKWHTNIFVLKQLSICGKQQLMTYQHVGHETVIHMWHTTANDIQSFLTWNSYPYVANNSKWHTSMFHMKQLSIYGKQQQMTHKHVCHETVIHMWQTTAHDTQDIFDMKQLSMFYLFIYLKYILPFWLAKL